MDKIGGFQRRDVDGWMTDGRREAVRMRKDLSTMIVDSVTSSNKTLHRFDQITQKDSGNPSIRGGVINQISGSETQTKIFSGR